jgi:hypothetical protein
MKRFVVAFVLAAACAFSQGNTGTISGTITDPTGAAVPAAEVTATNMDTGAVAKTSTGEKGEYVIPSLLAAHYRVSAVKAGFKTQTSSGVEVNAGVTSTANLKLEIGQATETVEVSAGAEMVQAASAEVSNTINSRQVVDLAFATRNAVELIVTQPGAQTPTNPRSSSINGLPKGAINITIDGQNTQDNMLKSSDGFFSYIMPSVDSIEEVTLTTSAGGVDSTSQGGAQIKFVTKSGTNSFHGGTFYQARNTFFNANYYYNNETGLARDIIQLRQAGGHVGGPIKKDKLFFFGNYEYFRNPGTKAYGRTVLTPSAQAGNYTYVGSDGQQRTINLYQAAAAGNAALPPSVRQFATTPDPILASTYSQIAKLTSGGNLTSNTNSGDYNTNTYNYSTSGNDARDFYTLRLDYNITTNHQLSLVYNYDRYVSTPDFLNNIVPVYSGTGTVLGTTINTGQRSNRFDGTLTLRSALTSHLTNEAQAGLNGGTVLFADAIGSSALFGTWKGYVPSGTGLSVTTRSSSSRRNAPVQNVSDTVSWVKGSHQFRFGGNYDQVSLFQQSIGSSVIPSIAFGAATGDPITTGATSIFTAGATGNFPFASSTQLSSAAALYSALTGRVSSITSSVGLDEITKKYGHTSLIDRDHIREMGLFVQDTWRIAPTFTLSLGLRYEKQFQFTNDNGTYSQIGGLTGLYGLSGVGNEFKPGTLAGSVPQINPVANGGGYKIPAVWAPSLGAAWQLPGKEGILGRIFGRHTGASVLRAGYSIATVREGFNVFTQIYGANPGLSLSSTVSNSGTPADFGPAGSVLFRDPTFPTRSGLPSSPQYPLTPQFTDQIFDFNPNLKMGYVQSWNLGFQREMGRNSVIEVRYTGNHGTKLWRLYGLNEINIFENGFLNEFKIAQNNLTIARGGNITQNTGVVNFGNSGLPGQQAIPILQTALGTTSDTTTASQLMLGQAGSTASGIATNAGRIGNLTGATSKACNGGPCPANMFLVNPTVGGGNAFILDNGGSTFYDALLIEARKRLSTGLQFQASYVFSKSLANGAVNSGIDNVSFTTLRDPRMDRVPEAFDIRNAIKLNWVYELPFGPGRQLLGSVNNKFIKKAIEGWELSGVMRLQSGTPFFFSGLGTFNSSTNDGVILHNITLSQIQDQIGIYKTSAINAAGKAQGTIFYLPPPALTSTGAVATGTLNSTNNTNLITNTMAAYNNGGLTPAQVDPSAPYISPAPAGQLGGRVYFYLPWQRHFDVSLMKRTRLTERVSLEFRAQALDVFNWTNFLPDGGIGSSFGQIGGAYRDISGTVDPGSRILEFVARINF